MDSLDSLDDLELVKLVEETEIIMGIYTESHSNFLTEEELLLIDKRICSVRNKDRFINEEQSLEKKMFEEQKFSVQETDINSNNAPCLHESTQLCEITDKEDNSSENRDTTHLPMVEKDNESLVCVKMYEYEGTYLDKALIWYFRVLDELVESILHDS